MCLTKERKLIQGVECNSFPKEKMYILLKKGKFDMYVIKSPQFTLYFENMESLKSKPEVFVLSKGTLMGYCIVQLYDDMEDKLHDSSERMVFMSSENMKLKKRCRLIQRVENWSDLLKYVNE